jgi:hypothetical protein
MADENNIVKADDAVSWYKSKIGDLANQKIEFKKESFPQIGKMYLFAYDAKHKDKLPFFDMFPLIFPIEYYSDGFLGLNLHYLPEGSRQELLNSLSSLSTDNKYTDNTKLNISYSVLKSAASKFSGYDNCIKRYLLGQVRSSFSYISPNDWSKAAALPLQKWRINPDLRYRTSSPPY